LRIALDAMGGDHAPAEIVAGALAAAPLLKGEIVLVGREGDVRACAPNLPANVSVRHAEAVVGMEEKPMEAFRRRKGSSIHACVDMVQAGEAQAMVSAGNTGACAGFSQIVWKTISGIHRPALAAFLPTRTGRMILLDAGASPDVDPVHLLDFALMGKAYAESVMGVKDARVHLVNIGEEPGKGNAFSQAAFRLLEGRPWFAGNIEGKDLFRGECRIAVCDAFVGNVVLKTAEGVAEFFMDEIRSALPKGPARLLMLPLKSALQPLKKKTDYAEYGGSPLLGLNGICIIGHGRSSAKAVKNALLQAARAVDTDLVGAIRRSAAAEAPSSSTETAP
jgi:glycerol-3-phosphate acyltransferase PlsX